MDWFQILILVLFFLFPLIQQGIEAARRSGEQEMPVEVEEDEEMEWAEEAQEVRAATLPPPGQDDGAGDWSSGWLDWPSQEGDNEAGQRIPQHEGSEVESVAAPAPVPASSPEPVPRLEDAPWALPSEPPTGPGGSGELKTSFGTGTKLAPLDGRPEVALEVTKPVALARSRASHPSQTALGRALATRSALRQAVVLHEVLGPPVALRGANDRPS